MVKKLLELLLEFNYKMIKTIMIIKKSSNKKIKTIFVKLLNEGIDVWKPVEVEEINGHYKILSKNIDPDNEIWEFNQGDIVKVKSHKFSNGTKGLIAYQ